MRHDVSLPLLVYFVGYLAPRCFSPLVCIFCYAIWRTMFLSPCLYILLDCLAHDVSLHLFVYSVRLSGATMLRHVSHLCRVAQVAFRPKRMASSGCIRLSQLLESKAIVCRGLKCCDADRTASRSIKRYKSDCYPRGELTHFPVSGLATSSVGLTVNAAPDWCL